VGVGFAVEFGFFCGMGEMDAMGLGVEDELPLFTVLSCGESFGISYLRGCLQINNICILRIKTS